MVDKPEFDDDIEALDLSYAEKSGLQVYRNYTNSFNKFREERFAEEINNNAPDTKSLGEIIRLVHGEEIRYVPILACAWADEELEQMFKVFLRDGIPGGKKALIGKFGPISSFFSRIQFAYAFDLMNGDVLKYLDQLRGHRNKLSHTWNPKLLEDFFKTPLPHMDGLAEGLLRHVPPEAVDHTKYPEEALRIQTMWVLCRVFYESRFYPLAKLAGLNPDRALYGPNSPRKTLGKICNYAMTFTKLTVPPPPPTSKNKTPSSPDS